MTIFQHLDATDRKLLTALMAKSDLTNGELAARVGLSESQCYRRRLRLEQEGAIRGYHASVDARALGLQVGAFIHLSMVSQSQHQRHQFASYIANRSNVISCHAVTGDADYILHVRTADLAQLNDFVNDLLAHGKDRLHVRSHIVLDTIKEK